MSKNQKHKEEVDRVFDIFKAMNEAIPENSTKKEVIAAAELIIVDVLMHTKARGLRLAAVQFQILEDISKLCDVCTERKKE